MTTVTITHLTKTYGAAHAVRDLSLEIASGVITALLGPSGCGKTTTLKLVAGLLEPTRGDLAFDDRSMLAVPAEQRGAVMVFQNHLLFPYMTVAENVGFGLRMRGVNGATAQRRVSEMLERVRLPGFEARKPHELSGGQQQRVALARALVTGPRVLLLDEPLSNLDAHLRDEMRELILALQRESAITTVVVTHDQEEAVILADCIALLFNGELHQFAEPRAFYDQPASERVARFFGGVNFLRGMKVRESVTTPAGVLRVEADCAPDGPVTLTVRPEALRFAEAEAVNVLEARLLSRVYAGTHTRFKFESHGIALEMVTDAARYAQHTEGEMVRIHVPPERLWPV